MNLTQIKDGKINDDNVQSPYCPEPELWKFLFKCSDI